MDGFGCIAAIKYATVPSRECNFVEREPVTDH